MADRTVSVGLRAEVSGFVAGIRTAQTQLNSFTNDLQKSAAKRQALTDLGNTAGKIGLVAAGGLAAVTKAAMDWETAWAGVTKTVDGSDEELAALEGQLRQLAKTLPATHEEIAGVAEAAGQLGVAREDIASFTETMIALGETTNLTAEEAATSIAQLTNVMGTAPDDVDNLGAALVALGNDGASTEAQIIQMAQRIAGAGAQIGLAESDILAIANATASMGIEVEAGGTSISRVFVEMSKAVSSGGDDLAAFAEIAGLTNSAFADLFATDPAQAFAALTQGLNRINESGGNVFATLDKIGLSDVRVSQALLGIASNSDLLTDSLELGKQAWADNTALAIEAAKRYDTSAAQVQVAWNNITDAAIEFGDAALPVLGAAAEKVAAFAQAVSGLPEPVKSAGTAMLGITAVLGGGLWFTTKVLTGVASMRENLSALGGTSGRTASALGKVGKAAGLAGVALAGLAIGEAIQMIDAEVVPGLEGMTGRLIDVGREGKNVGAEFDSLADSIELLANPGWADKINKSLADMVGFGHGKTLNEATAEIEALDESLAHLVITGNADLAADSLGKIADQYGLNKSQVEDLLSLMPQYEEALNAEENAADLAADAQGGLNRQNRRGASASAAQTEAIQDQVDAMKELRDAAIAAVDAEIAFEQAMDDAAKEARQGKRSLDLNTQAGRDNMSALTDLAGAWNAQDPAVKDARGAFARARQSLIETAIEMGATKKEAEALADSMLEVPERVVTDVVLNGSGQALNEIMTLDQALAGLDGTVAETFVRTIYTGGTSNIPDGIRAPGHAGGGPIFGPGSATSDSIPAWLSNGEYVVQASAVNKYGLAMLEAINAKRFSGGGHARHGYSPSASAQRVSMPTRFSARVENLGGLEMHFEAIAADVVDATIAHRDQIGRM